MFHKGDKVEVYQKSKDEGWQEYMDEFVGLHGIITDPDSTINDPDALVRVSLVDKGTHRLPQDCLRQHLPDSRHPSRGQGQCQNNDGWRSGDCDPPAS